MSSALASSTSRSLSSSSSSSSSGPWSCSVCTFLNTAVDSLCCLICGVNRFGDPAAALFAASAAAAEESHQRNMATLKAETPHTKWVCQSCTFVNKQTRDKCTMCMIGTRDVSVAATNAAMESTTVGTMHRTKRRKETAHSEISDEADDDEDGEDASASDDTSSSDVVDGDGDFPILPVAHRRTIRAKRSTPSTPAPAVPSSFLSPSVALASAFASPAPSLSFGSVPKFASPPPALPMPPPTPTYIHTPAKRTKGARKTKAVTETPVTPVAKLVQYTNEDSRPELTEAEASEYHNKFTVAIRVHKAHHGKGEEEMKSASVADDAAVRGVIQHLYDSLEYQPPAASSSSSSSGPGPASDLQATACQVCFTDFDASCHAVVVSNCGHIQLCSDCFGQYVSLKVKDEAVVPWIACPSPGCRQPLTLDDLVERAHLTTPQLAHMAVVYMRKRLIRAGECFVTCKTSNCHFGFYIPLTKTGKTPKSKKHTCLLCAVEQPVERGKDGELDPEFKKMIASRILRPCPKCAHLTLKEKGVCNVLQCIKCSVWWNWRTNETGRDSATLKNKARMSGTLWEHGELEYQRRLEQTDIKAFRQLLERNGGKYDPNYVRGQG